MYIVLLFMMWSLLIIVKKKKKTSKWMTHLKKYMLDLHFTLHTIEYSKPQYIRKIIKEFYDKLWYEDLEKKNSLILYREYKHVIHDERACMIIQQQQLL